MTDYELRHISRRPLTPAKKGKGPEATVSAACDSYLELIGCITIRTNAGSWADDSGHVIMGAKAGTSDKTCCLPNGRFCAVEVKAASGKLTEAQQRYLARVERLGGVAIVAHSKDELRAGLVLAFGLDQILAWEQAGRDRASAKQAEIKALKEKNRR